MIPLLLSLAFAESPLEAPEAAPPAPVEAPAAPAPVEEAAPVLPTVAPDPTPIVGPPAGPPRTGAELDAATREIASQLRCPVCQGLSVADSPSESAVAIKREVERLAGQGYSEEQCLFYFEASYGEFIRLEPKAEGLNLLVWAAPAGLLLAGLGIVGWMRLGGLKVGSAQPEVEPALLPYVEQVYAVVGRGQP